MAQTLQERLKDQPYQGYAYAYPHKTAYRHFDSPIPLQEIWDSEDQCSLYLYLHLPFCEMRCGFCNLFTTTNPGEDVVSRYLTAVDTQIEAAGNYLTSGARFTRGAVGGGTPSFLTLSELETLFQSLDKLPGYASQEMPFSFELSPATVTGEKLKFLVGQGITRFSIGVQSFLEQETKAFGRPQKLPQVHQALETIRHSGVEVMNIDLIYGADIQTTSTWRNSINEALRYEPEEIYLYPLYIRPLTGLEKTGRTAADHRIDLFRTGRDLLRENGYEQISMRLFRKQDSAITGGPVYCCQEDGMVGIGAGARSYTTELHYCTEYAVGRNGINEIIADYSSRTLDEHSHAVYGCHLSEPERKRRYLMKSLLRIDGLSLADYHRYFRTEVMSDFPELNDLLQFDLARLSENSLVLNDSGFERSDTIGPWLFSASVTSKMENYQPV